MLYHINRKNLLKMEEWLLIIRQNDRINRFFFLLHTEEALK